MPLPKVKKGKAGRKKIVKALQSEKPSAKRQKAIKTLAKRRGISTAQARHIQEGIIAGKKAGFAKKKKKSFQKGGKVKKTGTYKLHKGETVVPAKKRGKKKFNAAAFDRARKNYFGVK